MDEEYDCIVLGTGLTECILSVAYSKEFQKFQEKCIAFYIILRFSKFLIFLFDILFCFNFRDWNVDLIPKFLMAQGSLVKLLIHTGVTRYLEFKSIEGSYVMGKSGKISKVPADEKEALTSDLMGLFEKRRFKNFLVYVQEFDAQNPATWKDMDPHKNTTDELYKKYGLDENTCDFVGHALALYRDDEYRNKPCLEAIERIKLYSNSLAKYGKSPYLYPLYGLGELPQGFARLSAIYGGTYMNLFVVGVRSGTETAKCKQVYCDPTYVTDRVKKNGQVVRCICLLDHPIPNTKDALSTQIIIPQKQVGRNSDIYVTMVSSTTQVASKGWFIAMVSTNVETENPEAEIQPGINLLGPIKQKFLLVSDVFEPMNDGTENQIFISKSYDATSHFETTCLNVLDIFKRGTGEEFDFSKVKHTLEDDV
ncbi:rab GDP dissociation inhibitor beta [Eurytemora carolleeae]|uniref:rab GDP dissociation inhibitor beta n=1 Tax=Eurytemora carolleeae TaxID=1294199 RepID=UPI000C78209E|nr:rab GDP dissociation inhibitor beta [Eurytemora carolleeae]|eukprot:XP_023327887.1 rab GDP dissociation inhibitor beta-like [Eurytemora affinis]